MTSWWKTYLISNISKHGIKIIAVLITFNVIPKIEIVVTLFQFVIVLVSAQDQSMNIR